MPPKAKFSKEEIIQAAINVIRKKGAKALTARVLGDALGSSARPIFTIFQSMDEVMQEVFLAANHIFKKYLKDFMANSKYPPVQSDGMAYILFAKEETELFRLLFMRQRTKAETEYLPTAPNEIISIIQQDTGLSFEKSLQLDLEMWVYAHGIATMLATNYSDWGLEMIYQMLTDAYEGFKHRLLTLEET